MLAQTPPGLVTHAPVKEHTRGIHGLLNQPAQETFMQVGTAYTAYHLPGQPPGCMTLHGNASMHHAPSEYGVYSSGQHSSIPIHDNVHLQGHATAPLPPSGSRVSTAEHGRTTMVEHGTIMSQHSHGHPPWAPPGIELSPHYVPFDHTAVRHSNDSAFGTPQLHSVPRTMQALLPFGPAVSPAYSRPPVPVSAKQISENFVPTFHTKAKYGSWRKTYENCRLHNAQVYTTIYFENVGESYVTHQMRQKPRAL